MEISKVSVDVYYKKTSELENSESGICPDILLKLKSLKN